MVGGHATHFLDIGQEVVVKRFRSQARGEPRREWAALGLLARYAPGLAPSPVRADLGADPPLVVMSRLPGRPLGAGPLEPGQFAAVAASIRRLHAAVPPGVLDAVEPMPFGPATAIGRVRAMLAAWTCPADPAARRALREAAAWLEGGQAQRAAAAEGIAVFGHGDPNLANYLWDGRAVRLVDFEDSGRSDRAWEQALLTEHQSVQGDAQVPADQVLAQFGDHAAERARITAFRRLLATFWLLMLLPGGPSHQPSQPGTLQRQTRRLLELLD